MSKQRELLKCRISIKPSGTRPRSRVETLCEESCIGCTFGEKVHMSSSRWSSFASYFVCEEDCDPDISLSWPQTGAYVRTRHVLETPAPGPRPPRACLCLPLSPPFPRAISALHVIAVILGREKDVGSKKQRRERERERERLWTYSTPGDSINISRLPPQI